MSIAARRNVTKATAGVSFSAGEQRGLVLRVEKDLQRADNRRITHQPVERVEPHVGGISEIGLEGRNDRDRYRRPAAFEHLQLDRVAYAHPEHLAELGGDHQPLRRQRDGTVGRVEETVQGSHPGQVR